MAMVFSVQQGEHGPLVTYKLEVPDTVESAPSPGAMVPLSAAAFGTAALPAEQAATAPRSARIPGDADRLTAAYQRLFRSVYEQPEANALLHAYTGEAITLDQVSAELEWRRDTTEKLRRRTPFAPRF